ncbi:MAG: 3-dehydroquinate synthase [Gemmatimonadaceae bacterium]|nr:3-dehydroquinate synthase [Gemmatimonadaceae bacterium]
MTGAPSGNATVELRTISLPGYDVTVGRGALAMAGAIAATTTRAHHYAIVSDEHVAPLYAQRVRDAVARVLPDAKLTLLLVPAGEEHKTRELWAQLTDQLLASGAGRDTTVIALGGGVIGDLAGFVAATYMRGIPVVQLPTTLLAMVDASVGGKTAVDTPAGKNLVGAFHPPAAVIADPDTLGTLTLRELRAGFAEVVKHGVVADAVYFANVEAAVPRLAAERGAGDAALVEIVARSVEIKASVVAADERENGQRKILNFGHTLGHAIELVSGYRLLHGEAVAIGMALEARLAERLGIAAGGTAARVVAALEAAMLPATFPHRMDPRDVLEATRADKKARGGAVEYALPVRIGEMSAQAGRWSVAVPDEDVLAVLD